MVFDIGNQIHPLFLANIKLRNYYIPSTLHHHFNSVKIVTNFCVVVFKFFKLYVYIFYIHTLKKSFCSQ